MEGVSPLAPRCLRITADRGEALVIACMRNRSGAGVRDPLTRDRSGGGCVQDTVVLALRQPRSGERRWSVRGGCLPWPRNSSHRIRLGRQASGSRSRCTIPQRDDYHASAL